MRVTLALLTLSSLFAIYHCTYTSTDVLEDRRNAIRQATKHAWRGYKKHAGFKNDELRPVTAKSYNWMNMSITVFSALDTLYIMDLKDEYEEARDWAVSGLDLQRDLNVSFFETNIRVVGGLLGAYDLTKDKQLLKQAVKVADKMMPAFNNKGIIPFPSINLQTGKGYATWSDHVTTLAELGSFQLEFNYLSHHTNNPKYAAYSLKVVAHMQSLKPAHGLYPTLYNLKDGKISSHPSNLYTFGASSDSFYEYVLKQWLQTGKRDKKLRQMYDESVEGMLSMVYRSKFSHNVYIVEKKGLGYVLHEMDHLACFVPGMLALGAHGETLDRDMMLAEEMMTSCMDLYACSSSGLAPDRVRFHASNIYDFTPVDARYLLRPETLESLYVLWKKTGDEKYRGWAWKVFTAIERNCKTKYGYSGIKDATRVVDTPKDDVQHAYLLSETFKYLYLIFEDDAKASYDLRRVVFNTEAHALTIFHKSAVK
ncbi:hypothetical protein PROFUN_03323 [Planoprotostelium fungivorum]|uniref:alpha-1,2-Mannosidase n=1 Tax=Planoprotostelium fungivorum TaxID=1890364 RepID=A0A2P6NWS7_9EUKA|nr:hypothetical protein PROFUN_03323 [Planoprotostelium fungivorum]